MAQGGNGFLANRVRPGRDRVCSVRSARAPAVPKLSSFFSYPDRRLLNERSNTLAQKVHICDRCTLPMLLVFSSEHGYLQLSYTSEA